MQKLRRDNYIERMSTLLHLEEIQMEINILEFDLYRVRNFALVLDKSCVVLVEEIKMKRRILAGKNSWTV